MKRKMLKLFLTMGLVLLLGLAFVACTVNKEMDNAGDQAGNVTLNGKMYTVFGAPDGSLGETGDVCLNATTGELLRKTVEGWEKTEYQSYDAKNNSFIVSYPNGSVGTYSMAAENSECMHEEFDEVVVIYTAKCVVPGIGVKTCCACGESFPVIIPASGHHTFEEDGYSCEVCNEYHITTPQSMFKFETDANSGEDFSGETIYLDADIDLGEITGWNPIGNFDGVFEGKGHTIINPGDATASIDLDEVIVDDSGIFTADIAPENIHNLHVEIAIGNVGFTHQYEYGPVGGVIAEDYKVKSEGGLRAFRDEVNSGRNTFAGKTVNLTQTIDLGNKLFFRIGTNANGKRFSGAFNGNGFEIQNVKVANSATETAAQTMEIGEVFNTFSNAGTTSVTTAVDNCLSKDAVLNYTVHNYGDLEQIYTWKDYKNGSATKANNYAIGGERTWIVNNAAGMKLFRDRVNNSYQNYGDGKTQWQYRSYAYDTVKLADDIDLENEPFVLVGSGFAGVFESQGHTFGNVVTGALNTVTNKVEKSQEFGQVFSDYSSGTAEIDYKVHNEGDFEQISVYSKKAGEVMHADHQWKVNNVEGFKKFASIVNSTYKWDAKKEPNYPIQFAFAPTPTSGEARMSHTIHMMDDIDLENELFEMVNSRFAGTFASEGHTFSNVVTGLLNTATNKVEKSQEFGQVFSDYTSGTAAIDYKVHNEGDFEQISVYSKKAGEAMHADHQWKVNNVAGFKKFASIVNSTYTWNSKAAPNYPIKFTFAPTPTSGEARMSHTIHMMDDIDLENEPFVVVGSGFAGTFLSEEHTFMNVVTASVSTKEETLGQTLKSQAFGQVFADYSSGTAAIDYKVHNEGDFEQVSVYSKNSGEAMHADHQWYIHNADGMRLFSAITNTQPAWNAANRGDAPINFNFASTITSGVTRINHTIHMTGDIDLENEPFVRVGSVFSGVFDSGNYVFKNVCPTYSTTDLRQGQAWGQVFINNTQTNSDIHYTVRNGSDFEQVSTFSKERNEKVMYAQQDWYIYNETGFKQYAAINGSDYAYNSEDRGENPIYFEFKTTYYTVNGERVVIDSHTIHLMKDLTLDNFEYPNYMLNANKYRAFGGVFDGGNHTITFAALARTDVEMGRLIPANNLTNYERQADGTYLDTAKIINLKMAYADSAVIEAFGGYSTTYTETGEFIKPAWQIDSVARLTAFRDLVRNGRDFKNEVVILMTDLDLENAAWTSIGTEENPFRGTFNGNHKTISRFKISGGSYVGFFSKIVDSTTIVKDLTLSNYEVTGTADRVGGLAGYSSATVTNVVIDTATVKGNSAGWVGGFFGYGYGGTISDCTIKGSNITGGAYLGGISGQGYTKIKRCTVEDCTITALDWKAGGIIGQLGEGNFSSEAASLDDDVVKGTTLVVSDGLMGYSWGALVGFSNYGDKTFNRCKVIDCTIKKTSTGNLSGAGGFIGEYYAEDDKAIFNDCEIDGLNFENIGGGINGVGGFIGKGYWRGYQGLVVTFNNCSVRMGEVKIGDGMTTKSYGAFIGDLAANTAEFIGENSFSGCEMAIGTATGTITGEPKKKD